MHRYMARYGASNGTKRTLDRTLPGGSTGDWGARLREGLALVAMEGHWDPGRIHEVTTGAGESAADVARRVREHADQKGDGFLDGLRSLFRL